MLGWLSPARRAALANARNAEIRSRSEPKAPEHALDDSSRSGSRVDKHGHVEPVISDNEINTECPAGEGFATRTPSAVACCCDQIVLPVGDDSRGPTVVGGHSQGRRRLINRDPTRGTVSGIGLDLQPDAEQWVGLRRRACCKLRHGQSDSERVSQKTAHASIRSWFRHVSKCGLLSW